MTQYIVLSTHIKYLTQYILPDQNFVLQGKGEGEGEGGKMDGNGKKEGKGNGSKRDGNGA
jgi:hypothetical protein